jgi:uncharacterized protein
MALTDLTSGRQLDRPMFLRQLCTDEYRPLGYTRRDARVIAQVQDGLSDVAWSRSLPVWALADSKMATAAGLIALNTEWGERYYEVAPDATTNEEVAAAAFSGFDRVIDVQTHFNAPRATEFPAALTMKLYRGIMPDWWRDLDEQPKWDIAQWLTDVFIRTDNTIGVLTSGPGLTNHRSLFNDEIASTRALVERFGGSGRLLTHAVVHANVAEERDAMASWGEELRPNGWKVYTMGQSSAAGWFDGWMLDDELTGIPFLENVRDIGPRLVCSHKGISLLVDNGSPRDIGPAARMFPEITFLVYHSGYEFITQAPPEGPYTEETAHQGVNRLITSCLDAGIKPGDNVNAELGTTWFSLVRRPEDAAHVLGKLIKHLGEDNVVWGTDSIWYGAAQPILDAFRVFQIPDRMCEEFGYSKLTAEIKNKILYRNASRVYDIDLEAVRARTANDEIWWARAALAEVDQHGFLNTFGPKRL